MAKKLNWEKVHKSHMAGMSISEISDKLNMKPSDVRRIFSTKGLPISSDEDKIYIDAFKMYNNPSTTLKNVSKATGITTAILVYHFKRLKLRKY